MTWKKRHREVNIKCQNFDSGRHITKLCDQPLKCIKCSTLGHTKMNVIQETAKDVKVAITQQ